MDTLEMLYAALAADAPELEYDVDRSDRSTGSTWIDFKGSAEGTLIEFRPGLGFGIHVTPPGASGMDGFGEGPSMVTESVSEVVAEITKTRTPT